MSYLGVNGEVRVAQRAVRLQRPRQRAAAIGLPGLIGSDVEVRCVGGSNHRGTMRGIEGGFLILERPSGSVVLVAVSALVAIISEHSLVPRDAGEV